MKPLARGVLHAGFALTGVLTTLLGPVLPVLSARWRLDDAHSGLLFTAQFLGSLSGALLASSITPRLGVRAVIAVGFATSAAGVMGVCAGPWTAGLSGVAIWGVGLGLVIPSTNLLVAGSNPGRRAAALNVLNFAWGVGAVAAPPATAALMPQIGLLRFLWSLAFLLAAVALFVSLADLGVPAEPAPAAARPIWHKSWIWLTGAFLFLYVGVENSLAGWMPSYALRVVRAPPGLMATAQTGFWGAILGVRLLAPAVLRRISPSRLILCGLALAAAGMVVLLALVSIGGLIAGALLAGIGLAGVFPTAVALFTERAAAQGPRVTGLVFAMAALGGATVPWVAGSISTRSGSLRLALAVPLACGLLMMLLHLRETPGEGSG